MYRNLILGAVSAVALSVAAPAAQAADLPVYEPAIAAVGFSWTGAYIGAQTGYSWGRASGARPKGWQVGGYAGYNYQLDGSPVVIGIDTDFNYADIDDRRGGAKISSDWNGATRARLGYAFDRFLVYGAAGVAYSDREIRAGGSKDSKTAVGYTVGGGVEYAASDNIVVRGEYRYTDYGSDRFRVGGVSSRSSYSDHRALVGVAYKFNGF